MKQNKVRFMAVKSTSLYFTGQQCFFRIKVMSKLEHCVYVLLSQKDNQLYTGYTANLKQRLTDHFHGNSTATTSRRPFKLIFCEYFLLKTDALNRESYFKTSAGKKALKIMLKNVLADRL